MSKQLLHKFFIVYILFILSGLLVFISCSKDSNGNDITGGTTGPQKITSGNWTASTDFGVFDFVVNSESTYITDITITFDNWTIGSTTHNGSIGIGSTPGWQISNRQFSIVQDLNPFQSDEIMTFSGTFPDTGKEASGTWEADFDGSTDSGTWQASPVN